MTETPNIHLEGVFQLITNCFEDWVADSITKDRAARTQAWRRLYEARKCPQSLSILRIATILSEKPEAELIEGLIQQVADKLTPHKRAQFEAFLAQDHI